MKPDYRSAEFVLCLGTSPGHAGNPMQVMARQSAQAVSNGNMKLVIVDPVLGGGVPQANGGRTGWLPIKPSSDGALVMGMMRWIFDNNRFNQGYLECTTSQLAAKRGFSSYTNAAYLVISDPQHPNYRKFLRGKDMGWGNDDYVVVDIAEGKPISALGGLGQPFYSGTTVTADGVKIAVESSLTILRRNAFKHTLDDYVQATGISAETIAELAKEFTAHGTKVGTDHHGGIMGASAYQASLGIIQLNALVGSVNKKGGMMLSGGSYNAIAEGPRYDLTKFPGMVRPSGIRISRERTPYENTPEYKRKVAQKENPYPSTLPWYPMGFEIDGQAITSVLQGYPYKAKIAFFWMQNQLFVTPGLYNEETVKALKDPEILPLIIACDVVMSETAAYADYIIPDTHFYESWGVPAMWNGVATKMTAARWPVISPLTPQQGGVHMSIEAYLLAAGKQLNLPGCGDKSIPDTQGAIHPLQTREDFFLKALANVAYDGQPVPDVSQEEVGLMDLDEIMASFRSALSDEEWRKVCYVLARGGRFEGHDAAYIGDDLKYKFPRMLNIYNEKLGNTRNSQTGEYFEGTAVWVEPVMANGKPLEEKFSAADWPFTVVSQKSRFRTGSMLANVPVLMDMQKENKIQINAQDASALGLSDGERVKVITPTAEVIGKVKVRNGIARGTIGVTYSFGHWQYGAQHYSVDGKEVAGQHERGGGFAFNPLGMHDPSVTGGANKMFPLADLVAGASARNTIRAKLVKV
ncbi:MAG: molybdopterin-dependent oxidoreductase [Negativicutes bacterium]|nr:molybdopterin-dependent oxidoreductase [Negativicutes bacterium]